MNIRTAFALLAAALLSACALSSPTAPDQPARQSGFMGSGHVAAP